MTEPIDDIELLKKQMQNKLDEEKKKNNQLQTQLDESNDKIKEYEQKNNNLTNEINQLDNKLFQQEEKLSMENHNLSIDLEKAQNNYNEIRKSFNKTVECANILLTYVTKLSGINIYQQDIEELKNIKLNNTLPKKIKIDNINFFLILIGKMMACCAKYHLKFTALKKALNETSFCKYQQFEKNIEKNQSLSTLDNVIKKLDQEGFKEICTEILKKQKEKEEEMEKRRKIQREKEEEMRAMEEEMRAMEEKMKNRKSLKF